jgi:predicted GTPase
MASASSVPLPTPTGLTADEVEAAIAVMYPQPAYITKVLVLGNSGTGKSWICNTLLLGEFFCHLYSGTSVTDCNTFGVVQLSDGGVIVVCNIPGLIESDPANIPRNVFHIQAAFNFLPTAKTVAMFVMSGVNGRLLAADYEALRAVRRYVELPAKATAVVVNGVDRDEAPADYDATTAKQVRAILEEPTMTVDFIEKIPKAQRINYQGDGAKRLNARLVVILKSLSAVVLRPEPDAKLVLDADVLKADLEQVKRRIEDQERQHALDMAAKQAEWEAEKRAQEETHAARLRATDAEIAALKARPPTIIEQHHHHHSNDSGCVIS